eukprot:TRINITY_DN43410_c0_g1_i1.p1 TRINITY_DN43410_c0_g1~~TRINITY_DN43410_c0_g1_i1.p1  ORF type:complete len:137 (+),score=8.38 TRINITY_DN43410_c0_g1_i1:115-525(+)
MPKFVESSYLNHPTTSSPGPFLNSDTNLKQKTPLLSLYPTFLSRCIVVIYYLHLHFQKIPASTRPTMASPPTKSTSTSIALMLMQLVLPFLVHIHVNCFEINVDVGECNQDQLLPPTASMPSICTRYGLFCVDRVL